MPVRRALPAAVGVAGALVAAAAGAWIAKRRALITATVSPELRSPALYLPLTLSSRSLRFLRRGSGTASPTIPGILATHRELPTSDRDFAVGVWCYEPPDRLRPGAAIVYIHGGGYVMGSAVAYNDRCSQLAADLGALVVSVDYRLAPESPAPAAVEDCYTALSWVHAHAVELGIDPARIAIAGDSAGGGLTASLAQLAFDRGDVAVAFQVLIYPMLDDRTVLRTDDAGTGHFIWTPSANRFGWTSYVGHEPSAAPIPHYVAAARREDLQGLPPAWIGVGDLDLFHEENLRYAQRLTDSGVPCELYQVAGMYHGADRVLPDASSMLAFREAWTEALRAGLSL